MWKDRGDIMAYTINANAKNVWIRDNENTRDLSIQTDASSVYLENGRTLEHELGEGSMVSNVATVDSAMSKVIDGTYDGAYESLVFKGKSLVNVAQPFDRGITDVWATIHLRHSLLKQSTKYYYQVFDLPSGFQHVFTNSDGSTFLGTYTTNNISTFTTNLELTSDRIVLHINDGGKNALTQEQLGKIKVMVIEYQQGMENWDIPCFTGLCDVKMPILRTTGKNWLYYGETLGTPSITSYSLSNNELTITNDGAKSYQQINFVYKDLLNYKGKTLTLSGYATPNKADLKPCFQVVFQDSSGKTYYYGSTNSANTTKRMNRTFTIPYDISSDYTPRIGFVVHNANESGYSGTVVFSEIMLEESPSPTTYENHKTNILLPSNGEIKVTEDMFEQGGINGDVANVKYEQCKSTRKDRVRLKEVIPVKPSTHYAIINKTEFVLNCFGFTNRQTNLDNVPAYVTSFVTGNTTDGIALMLCKKDGTSTITPSEIDFKEIQLIEVDKTVTLRSLPNGVKDTLNLMTGEYVQRIGEVVLDGSNDENWEINYSANSSFRYVISVGAKGYNNDYSNIVCDKYQTKTANETYAQQCGVSTNSNGVILFYEPKVQVNDANATTWRAYLQSNPITVQYELAEPIIKTVNLWSTNNNPTVGDIVLPNGVKDEYNAKTGVYTKRIGKIVLDGSENWTANLWSSNGEYFISYFQLNGMKRYLFEQGISLKSDIFPAIAPVSDSRAKQANTEFIATYGGTVGTSKENWLHLSVKASKLSPASSEGIKNYLKQNPVTVWYELAEPQTIQLTPEFAKATPFAYANGHVMLESGYEGQSLLPTLDYSTITNRTGQIKSIGEQVLKQDKQINAVERLLLTSIVTMNYSNTLLKLNLTMDEVK